MAIDTLTWLTTDGAQEVIAAASGIGADPNAIERLRKHFPEFTAEQVGAAIHQSWLRTRAGQRWATSTEFLMTTDGLEQATRPAVAHFHAQLATRLCGPGANIVDLTVGLGFDAAAFSAQGHHVLAVERDQDIAILAAHNLKSFNVDVVCADATQWTIPSDTNLVFVDPARRDPKAARGSLGKSARNLNPQEWSPSWDFLESTSKHHRVIAKVAPGIADNFIENWDTYFVSCDGDLVEALVVSGGTGKRTAVLLRGDQVITIEGGDETPATEVGEFLVVPDAALVRARALTWLANRSGGALVHPKISWLTTSNERTSCELASDPMRPASVFSVVSQLPFDQKLLKREIASMPHSALTIMTRGVQLDVERIRKSLVGTTSSSAPELVLAVFRGESATQALLCRRLS